VAPRNKKGQFTERPANSGRKKGSRNKFTSIKQSFIDVFNKLNPDGEKHLLQFAQENPQEFYKLAAKLLPKEVNESVQVTVRSADVPLRPQSIEEWIEREPLYMATTDRTTAQGN